MENKDNKKNKKIIIIISIFAILVIFSVLIIGHRIQNEKFNNDLKNICSEVFEKEDFTKLRKFVLYLKNDSQEEKVYTELEHELKENADVNITNYEKSNRMLKAIDEELNNNKDESKLNSILSIGQNLYTYNVCLNNGNKESEKENYYWAYCVYENGKKAIVNIDEEKTKIIENKQENIYDKAKKEAKAFLMSKIKSSEIDEHISYSGVKKYIDIVKDEELTELYSKWDEHNEKLKKAEKEEREKEKKARKKQQGVRIGMSEQDVLDSSWGKPTKINKSVYSWGTYEQWVYPNYNYLYFENGKLTSIQTNE